MAGEEGAVNAAGSGQEIGMKARKPCGVEGFTDLTCYKHLISCLRETHPLRFDCSNCA